MNFSQHSTLLTSLHSLKVRTQVDSPKVAKKAGQYSPRTFYTIHQILFQFTEMEFLVLLKKAISDVLNSIEI